MKKMLLVVLALCAYGAIYAQDNAAETAVADIAKIISFKELDHDFGKIAFGKPVEF